MLGHFICDGQRQHEGTLSGRPFMLLCKGRICGVPVENASLWTFRQSYHTSNVTRHIGLKPLIVLHYTKKNLGRCLYICLSTKQLFLNKLLLLVLVLLSDIPWARYRRSSRTTSSSSHVRSVVLDKKLSILSKAFGLCFGDFDNSKDRVALGEDSVHFF